MKPGLAPGFSSSAIATTSRRCSASATARSASFRYPRSTSRADSWLTPRGIMDDLIDMLLLARTQRLFASYLSTFSEVAWWLGGTTARVSVF